eukprot:6203531-Pleurochrysis_carterae.AAC.1
MRYSAGFAAGAPNHHGRAARTKRSARGAIHPWMAMGLASSKKTTCCIHQCAWSGRGRYPLYIGTQINYAPAFPTKSHEPLLAIGLLDG